MSKPFDIELYAQRISSRLMLSGEKRTGAELAREFDLDCSQRVRACVNYARKQGNPQLSRIASDETGYWYAKSFEEAASTMHHLRGRAFSILDAARGLAASFGVKNIEQEELSL